MISAYGDLLDTHKDIFQAEDHLPQLVIVLDEAAGLRKPCQHRDGLYIPSDVLCRVISIYSKRLRSPIWVVFASTESKISAPNDKCE